MEDIAREISKNKRDACIFGDSDFKFGLKEGITEKFDFFYDFLPDIPDNLDKYEDLLVVPFFNKDIRSPQSRRKLTELKENFPFLNYFAYLSKNKKDCPIVFTKTSRYRPVKSLPPMQVYKVNEKELKENSVNWNELNHYLNEKKEFIRNINQ